ncbi:universal stress protein [Arthrobacter sp. CAL618]|uniref:universal stress protein n=1 Tax=Arthrobacter sp. CAL618 TaxID=1055770 RepID=UPI0003F590D0|nr:universal stress protein [Arthrobacter sp. CAL618]
MLPGIIRHRECIHPQDWNYEEATEKGLDQALEEAFPAGAPSVIERRIVRGNPCQVLIKESANASMVVVGSRGHGGFAGLLLGSVSSAVAERAACPVLVSHGAPRQADGDVDASPIEATKQ